MEVEPAAQFQRVSNWLMPLRAEFLDWVFVYDDHTRIPLSHNALHIMQIMKLARLRSISRGYCFSNYFRLVAVSCLSTFEQRGVDGNVCDIIVKFTTECHVFESQILSVWSQMRH